MEPDEAEAEAETEEADADAASRRRARQSVEEGIPSGLKTIALEEEREMRRKGCGDGSDRSWRTNSDPTSPTPMTATATVREASFEDMTVFARGTVSIAQMIFLR